MANKNGEEMAPGLLFNYSGTRIVLTEDVRPLQEKINILIAERDHWKANYDEMVRRNFELRERLDVRAEELLIERDNLAVEYDKLKTEHTGLLSMIHCDDCNSAALHGCKKNLKFKGAECVKEILCFAIEITETANRLKKLI